MLPAPSKVSIEAAFLISFWLLKYLSLLVKMFWIGNTEKNIILSNITKFSTPVIHCLNMEIGLDCSVFPESEYMNK